MSKKKITKKERRALKRAGKPDAAFEEAVKAVDATALDKLAIADAMRYVSVGAAELLAKTKKPVSLSTALALPNPAPANGLADAARLLRAEGPNAFRIGDEIESVHKLGKMRWAVVGIDCDELRGREHTLTLINITPLVGHCFDAPTLQYRFGRTSWHDSSVRAYLHGEFLDGFTEDDLNVIGISERHTYSFREKEYVHTHDKLFLLSVTEAGFGGTDEISVEDEGEAYPYFKFGASSRQLTDKDGIHRNWALRSSSPWGKINVSIVNDSGELAFSAASDGSALAVACVIG